MTAAHILIVCGRCRGDGCEDCGFTGECPIILVCERCGARLELALEGWACPHCNPSGGGGPA